MKFTIQKTKKVMILRLFNCLLGLLAFTGLLIISIGMMSENVQSGSTSQKIILSICTLIYISSFYFEYFNSRKVIRALDGLTQNITGIEERMAVSLDREDEAYYITAISDILNQSLMSLDEKNLKLESEIERNQRLSESISEFYIQMRTLRETDFRIDFFEYDFTHEIFIFITGLVTLIEDNEDVLEITTKDLLNRFDFSITREEFNRLVDRSIRENEPLDFELSVNGPDGEKRWMKFWGRLCGDRTRITGALTDITREVTQRNLEKERAIHDNMTGFYNRNALSEVAGKALADCRDGEKVAFIFIGLTGYQEFQERFGMMAGNSYIRVCAEVLKKFLNPYLIPFRWLGPDFLLLATRVRGPELFKKEADEIIHKVQKYMGEVEGIAVSFQVAVGYSISGTDGEMPADLLEYASFAEHEALRGERVSPNPFNRERYEEAKRASLRRTFIKDIIDRNQLRVVFQPIISIKTGELFGFEALSRPTNPIYKNIVELIDDAEATGHYTILEKRMVYNALDAYMMRDDRFRDHYLFINTAPFATLDEQDYNDIRDRYFGHMKVVFEVVERNRMDPDEINLRKSIVTKAGAKFALDDFGSGYSNHLALLALEPDIIKIDRELVRGIGADLRKQHMLEDIISYARYRGTRVLAEGVETKDELETLCRMGIDYAQGYFLGMPEKELAEPVRQAQEVIRTMGKNSDIGLGNLLVLLKESMAEVDREMSRNASITAYLVMKMATKLKIKGEKLAGLIIAAMIHDMGAFSSECTDWRNRTQEKIPRHCLFAYFVMREYFPYDQCAETVLYHHCPWSERNEAVLKRISIPDEADMLSLADDAAGLIPGGDQSFQNNEELLEKLRKTDHNPLYLSVFEDLCKEGMLGEVASGDYTQALLNYTCRLHVGKSEIESVIRTFVYAVTFRTPHTYSHARMMEVTTSFLARLTKQNWKLVERLRHASLIYNLARLPLPDDTPELAENAYEENKIIRGRLKNVGGILEKAALGDIMDMINAAYGMKRVSSKNRVLMSKDIMTGAKILNIADLFASLLEDRGGRAASSCSEAIHELINLYKSEKGYLSMIETMQDYADDIEGRIQTAKAEIDKRYHSIMNTFNRQIGR